VTRSRRFSRPRTPQPTAVEVCAAFEPYRLIQARQLAAISRADIGQHLGVPAWQILHWETAISVPKAYQLEQLAELLKVPVPFFKRGRPMAILDSGHLFMCTVDR
jgi:transcriptional regulator with XRE-family HTH domain